MVGTLKCIIQLKKQIGMGNGEIEWNGIECLKWAIELANVAVIVYNE